MEERGRKGREREEKGTGRGGEGRGGWVGYCPHRQVRGHDGEGFPGGSYTLGVKDCFQIGSGRVKEIKAIAQRWTVTTLFKIKSGFL